MTSNKGIIHNDMDIHEILKWDNGERTWTMN